MERSGAGARWQRWRERSRERAAESERRRDATRVRKCKAPRCWGNTVPGGEYCALHQRH